jgi:hypothetical protein
MFPHSLPGGNGRAGEGPHHIAVKFYRYAALEEFHFHHRAHLLATPDYFATQPRQRARHDFDRAAWSQSILGQQRLAGDDQAVDASQVPVKSRLVHDPQAVQDQTGLERTQSCFIPSMDEHITRKKGQECRANLARRSAPPLLV